MGARCETVSTTPKTGSIARPPLCRSEHLTDRSLDRTNGPTVRPPTRPTGRSPNGPNRPPVPPPDRIRPTGRPSARLSARPPDRPDRSPHRPSARALDRQSHRRPSGSPALPNMAPATRSGAPPSRPRRRRSRRRRCAPPGARRRATPRRGGGPRRTPGLGRGGEAAAESFLGNRGLPRQPGIGWGCPGNELPKDTLVEPLMRHAATAVPRQCQRNSRTEQHVHQVTRRAA